MPRPNGLSAAEEATLLDLATLATREIVRYRDAKRAVIPESLIISTSHELRTPLGALQLALTLLTEDSILQEQLDAKQHGVLVNAKRTSDLLAQLCEHSFDMLRNNPRHRGLSVISTYALREQINLIATHLKRQVLVNFSVDKNIPESILSNEISLLQIALNLIDHGLNTPADTSIELRLKKRNAHNTAHKLHDELVFECQFRPSDEVDVSADVIFKDHLGLQSLVYWTSVLCGHYGCAPTGERNVLFFSAVPLFQVADEDSKAGHVSDGTTCMSFTAPSEGTPKDSVTNPARDKCALVIEDSLVVRKTIIRALKSLGYATKEAKDGLEGLKCLKDSIYDVVLCDFLMPVMDGLDCMKQYREWESKERPSLRQYIVGMSAHISSEASHQGFEAGMDDFRPKPISIQTLEEILESDKVKKKTIAQRFKH